MQESPCSSLSLFGFPRRRLKLALSGLAPELLDDEEHRAPAVQHRDRKQVDQRQERRNHGQEIDELDDAPVSDLAGHAGLALLTRVDDGSPNAVPDGQPGALGGDQMRFSSSNAASNQPIIEFTLRVIPEPSSGVLAVMGLTGLACLGWRRRKWKG